MTRQIKVLVAIMIILIALLAGTSGFFFAKIQNLEKKVNQTGAVAQTKEVAKTSPTPETKKTEETVTTKTAETVTTPAPAGERPSSPSETVKVEQGETLFAISQKVDVSWVNIAEANGIDADKIKAGQTLIVPKNNQVGYTINTENVEKLQKSVNAGKLAFRISAEETAKSDASPVYGLGTSDTYKQTKIDLTAGTAEVTVTHQDKKYLIKLAQPATKGEKGIWAIESIKPQS